MIKSLKVKAFTVFRDATFEFGKNLNVIVGENGAGKTHVLKLAYSILATSFEERRKAFAPAPTPAILQSRLAEKLVNVFRPESLGRLVQRGQGSKRCDVRLGATHAPWDIAFHFNRDSSTEIDVDEMPTEWVGGGSTPVYMPTRELLTIYPGFVSVYDGHYLEFEETWRDTCVFLGAPLRRDSNLASVDGLLRPLQEAMGGSIELDKNGHFYFKRGADRMEMPLVAEGLRKLAMLARLIATGVLLDLGCLFWDEPEANLNPSLIRRVARSIVDLSEAGIQIVIATHSLFLLRELSILLASRPEVDVRFFGLHASEDTVTVQQGPSIDDIGEITALTESLAQSDRYLEQDG